MRHYFEIYFIFIITIFSIVTTGYLLLSLLGLTKQITGNYKKAFLSLLTGSIFIVCCVSLYKTNFKTVNIGILIIGILLYYEFYKIKKINYTNTFSILQTDIKSLFKPISLLEFIFFSLATYLISVILYYDPSDLLVKVRNMDLHSYNLISETIYATGQENSFALSTYFYPEFQGITPYHYFELWLNGFFSHLFDMPGLLFLSIVLTPFFYFTITIGILALFENYGVINYFTKFASLGLLFVGGVILPLNGIPYLEYANGFVISIASQPSIKFAPYYIIILTFLLINPTKNPTVANLTLLMLTILSITSFFAVLGGIFIYTIIAFLKKRYDWKTLLTILIHCSIITAYLIIIYIIWGNRSHSTSTEYSEDLIFNWLREANWQIRVSKLFAERFIITPIKGIIIYLPYILIGLLFLSKKELKNSIALSNPFFQLLTIIVCGLILSFFFSNNINHHQLFYNLFVTITNLFFVVFFIKKILGSKKTVPVILFAGIIFYNIYCFLPKEKYTSPYSEEFIRSITQLRNNKISNPIGCYLKATDDYKTTWEKMTTDVTGKYLYLIKNYKGVICLNPYDIPLSDIPKYANAEKGYVNTSDFHIFVEKQKKNKTFKSVVESQLDFINEFKIDFIILSKSAQIPITFTNKIDTIIKDQRSGERFALIKKSGL